MREGRKRTNVLDFNKELSQQIAKPYINHAKTLGDLPAVPGHISAPLGLPHKSELQSITSQLYSQGIKNDLGANLSSINFTTPDPQTQN